MGELIEEKKSVGLFLLKSKAANPNAFLCQEILCTVKFNQQYSANGVESQ